MARWAFWTDRSRPYITLAVAVVISIILLTMGASHKMVVARTMTITILAPVQKGISWFNQLGDLLAQNRRLRRLNTELALENQLLREAQLENVRLRQLLSFRERERLSSILLAEVIAREPGRQMNSILIGAGRDRGLRRNQPVVTSQGLVGKVVQVFPRSSLVQLLMDRNCPVSAMIQRTRISGLLSYHGGTTFRLENVPWRMDVRKGDEVISSGLGELFPKGLRLGRVREVRSHERSLFKEIIVEPSVDFNSLEEVFVIIQPTEESEEVEP
jgi:rod shape-determining protein MreC